MLSPDEIAQRRFLVSLRGFDRDEVTEFLREVGDEVRQLRTRGAELEAELAQARRTEPADVDTSDPRAAFRSLGEETTRILVAAEESADEIQAKAKAAGRATLEDARREARETTEQANRQAARTIAEAERRRDAIAAEIASLRDDRDALVERLRVAVADVADVVGGLDDGAGAAPAVDGAAADALPTDGSLEELRVTVAPEAPSAAPDDADTADPVVARDLHPDTEEGPDATEPDATEPDAPGVAAVTASTTPPADAEVPADEDPDAEQAAAEVVESESTIASRREASLAEPRQAMSRRCKRGLQDVQNEVLASIREQGRAADLGDLLPSDTEVEQLADLGGEHLEAAYRAAREDAAAALDGQPPADPGGRDRIESALATFRTVLTHEVTSALRATLRAGLEADEPEPQLSERVGEAFRDLRGPVLEGVVDEQLFRTYGLGLVDTWQDMGVAHLRWEVDHEARCPENRCRTNAAEGPVELGADFPSGDRVPPAHPGCTCVVVPA